VKLINFFIENMRHELRKITHGDISDFLQAAGVDV
jgi:hypothetical protein